MIRQSIEYRVYCSNCKKGLTTDNPSDWDNKFEYNDFKIDKCETRKELLILIDIWGWKRINKKWLCPNCQKNED